MTQRNSQRQKPIRRVEKQPKRKGTKKRISKRKIPAKQGLAPKSSGVGYAKPPVEHQFQPGQSGNPNGPPVAKSNLWRWFCHFLELTPDQLGVQKRRRDLTMAQRTALKQAEQLVKKGLAGTAWLATREAWNRDEGKPTEHVRYEREEALSAEECEEIRRAMKGQTE